MHKHHTSLKRRYLFGFKDNFESEENAAMLKWLQLSSDTNPSLNNVVSVFACLFISAIYQSWNWCELSLIAWLISQTNSSQLDHPGAQVGNPTSLEQFRLKSGQKYIVQGEGEASAWKIMNIQMRDQDLLGFQKVNILSCFSIMTMSKLPRAWDLISPVKSKEYAENYFLILADNSVSNQK